MSLGTLYIISAPSGAGKTSLVKKLVATLENVRVSVSHTTRARRPNERESLDYYFVTRKQFEMMKKSGEFLEYAQVFDNYYGTCRSAVVNQLNQGKDVILEIDWQGARQVRNHRLDCCSIFILPPSRADLEKRLHGRGQDTDENIQRRMRDADKEMQHYSEFEYIVINDSFDQALNDLKSIFAAQRLKLAAQRQRHQHLFNTLFATS